MPPSSSLAGLVEWLDRDEWRERFEELLWRHVGPACEEAGLAFEDLEDVLGRHHFVTLWGCAFEDFLTRALEPDGRNIVDDYLKRRGWREPATNRRYMRALRGSTMSLYEVSGVVPGEAFLARDLVRGGEPVRVSERTATRTLAPWERIGARVLEVEGTRVIAGGVLAFTHEAAGEAVRVFKAARTRARRELGRLAKSKGAGAAAEARPDPAAVDRLVLEGAAPVFTNLWFADALPRVRDPRPPSSTAKATRSPSTRSATRCGPAPRRTWCARACARSKHSKRRARASGTGSKCRAPRPRPAVLADARARRRSPARGGPTA
jgi:hypothetical protein